MIGRKARKMAIGLLCLAALPVIAIVADALLGRAGAALCVVAWILWLLSRIGNRSGSILMLGILFLIAISVLGLLVAGLALTHRSISG